MTSHVPGLEINISRQWTIGPLAMEIWWSCQISGGPDLANRTIVLIKSNTAYRMYPLPYKTFCKYLVIDKLYWKRYDIGHKKYLCTFQKCCQN